MMGNRKQPFGYKMALGEIVIQESEAKLVQEIFLRYIAGESLNELTESLRHQDIQYDEGRLWNKNMIARILADTRYIGEKGYGKKYCHNSPTLDEAPLQQAILAALNTAMADKNSLIRQITDAMETEIIPFPGGTMSLGDIERRLRELEQQFQTLLEKATDDPAAYGGQFKEILDEQTLLKERRSGILANNNEQAKANQRIMDAAQTLENASPYITEWDESAVRQLVETVKILSKDEIAVTLKGGIEICQKIMY